MRHIAEKGRSLLVRALQYHQEEREHVAARTQADKDLMEGSTFKSPRLSDLIMQHHKSNLVQAKMVKETNEKMDAALARGDVSIRLRAGDVVFPQTHVVFAIAEEDYTSLTCSGIAEPALCVIQAFDTLEDAKAKRQSLADAFPQVTWVLGSTKHMYDFVGYRMKTQPTPA